MKRKASSDDASPTVPKHKTDDECTDIIEASLAGKSPYLEGAGLRFDEDKLLDTHGYAVMMEWERPMMDAHARFICADPAARRVLNVGCEIDTIDA